MAKNGVVSEHRRENEDIPVVLSNLADIEGILPPLPKEGPYPARTYDMVGDLIKLNSDLGRRYVLGLAEEGYLVRVPVAEEDNASGSSATVWRLVQMSSGSDIVLPQDLPWGDSYAKTNVKDLPTEPTFEDLQEALKAPRYVPPAEDQAGSSETADQLRALYSSVAWERVTSVTDRLLIEVTDALPIPNQCTPDMGEMISFARLRLFWHRLRHTGVIPDELIAYLRNDDADTFAEDLNSSWDEFMLRMEAGAWDWDSQISTGLSRLEEYNWEGLLYSEDADAAWMPTIRLTTPDHDAAGAGDDPMDVDIPRSPGEAPELLAGQEQDVDAMQDVDAIGQLPQGMYYVCIWPSDVHGTNAETCAKFYIGTQE